MYAVNKSLPNQFVEFGLKKFPNANLGGLNDKMAFSFFAANNETFWDTAHQKIQRLLLTKTDEEDNESIDYDVTGFTNFEDHIFLFVDVSRWKDNNILSNSRNELLWFVILDEIKRGECCGFPIDELVTHFMKHAIVGYPAPEPIAVYHGVPFSHAKFIAKFGPPMDEETQQYFFTDLEHAWKQTAGLEKGGGIARFAFFPETADPNTHVWTTTDYHRFTGLSYHGVDKKTEFYIL
jgi:hypothetical protein